MNDELQNKIREILKSQTASETPKLTRRVVLPPLGKSAESRSIALDTQVPSTSSAMGYGRSTPLDAQVTSTSFKLPSTGYGRSISLERHVPSSSGYGTQELKDRFSAFSLLESHHSAPLITRESVISLDLNEIPENEMLSRISTARDRDELDVQTDKITVVKAVMATMPEKLPAFSGLSTVLDNLSAHRLSRILEACRLYDEEERGYLSQPVILKCIGEVVPSAHAASSPWRHLIHLLAPEGEFLPYEEFLELIESYKQEEENDDNVEMIVEVLSSPEAHSILGDLPSRASSSQSEKEKGREMVMREIEHILLENVEVDLDRLIHSTHKKVMSLSELCVLLELYALFDPFQPFLQTLFDSFKTREGLFHFSAFIGCIENLRCRRNHKETLPK